MNKITPFLWFDKDAEEAMNLYVSIFKNSKVHFVRRDAGGKVFTCEFVLDGQRVMALNAGPMFKFTEAISFFIECEDQQEVDELWGKLLSGGGTESQCGWLKDRFGLSWQVVPQQLGQLLGDSDPVKAERVMQAMLKMKKIDVKELENAYNAS